MAVKLVVAEPGSDAATALIARPGERIAPDWLLVEVASALSNKVRYEGLDVAGATAALAALPRFIDRFVEGRSLLERTMMLSVELGHALYDCLYLMAALDEGGIFVTADSKLHKAAGRAGYHDRVELLA